MKRLLQRRDFLKGSGWALIGLLTKPFEAPAQIIPFAFFQQRGPSGILQMTQILMLAAASGNPPLQTTQVMMLVAAQTP